MESRFIENIFKDYVSTPDTSYALLINGTWGSGKTYFWKSKLSRQCEEAKLKPIYLSLNGLSKIETLDYQLKIKLIPYLNKLDTKKASAIVRISKTIFNKLAEKYGNFNPEDILKDVEIDLNLFSNNVVCFDDLERCKIPLSEVLGYVNDFVEHKRLKVLFLSDESKIISSNDENYDSIKEKVIGRILTYKNDLKETLPLLFKKYEEINNEFYLFLKQKENLIYSYLTEFQEENLRNISFYFENVMKSYSVFKAHPDYIDEVLYFSLVFTIEFKNGNLTSKDYDDYKGYDDINSSISAYNFSKPNSDEEKPKDRLELFHKKYIEKDRLRYNFYPSIYQFILTGYLDNERLNSELQKRHPIEIPLEIKAYQKLLHYNFRNLPNTEFNNLFQTVFEYAKNGKYSIYDYYQISIFFNFFSDCQLIKMTKEEIQKVLLVGINIAKEREEINDRSYVSVFHFRKENEGDIVIVDCIKDAHNSIKAKQEAEKTNELLTALSENDIESIKMIFREYQVQKELFQFIAPNHLFNAIELIENETLTEFKYQLEVRYSSGNTRDFLSNDFEFLNKLNGLIMEKIKDKDNYQVQDFLFKELSIQIDEICRKLKS